jgi:hypothetical protein
MTALVRSLQISEKKTIDAVLPSRFCIRQSGRHRPQTDSLITDSQKGYFSFDNVVTLVAQQIYPSESTSFFAEILSQMLKTSGDSALPQVSWRNFKKKGVTG